MTDESGFQVAVDAPNHYHTQVERFMAPFVAALVSRGLQTGDAVLDVACGTGFATRAAASVVGRAGRVVGVDLNPSMVAMARSVGDDSDVDVSWIEASALDMPFADGEFDAVISQQGIQFFPDIAAGLQEMARTVRPQGTIRATVWAPIEEVPFLGIELEMLAEYCGHNPADSAGAFATQSEVAGWFAAAGLRNASVELVEVLVKLPPVSITCHNISGRCPGRERSSRCPRRSDSAHCRWSMIGFRNTAPRPGSRFHSAHTWRRQRSE